MKKVELKMAQQDMLLDEIMNKSKEREIKQLSVPRNKTDILGQSEEEQHLMLRQ